MITLERLQHIFPRAGHRASVFLMPINDTLDEFGIDTPLRAAAFLAQIGHESAELRYVAEIADGRAYDGRDDLGNTKAEAIRIATMNGTTPGRWWKGHGLIQITGYDNHAACGLALRLDLVNHPSILELPAFAAKSAGWFWKTHNLNQFADAEDIDGVSDVINRGRKTARYGDANGFKRRLAYYEAAKEVLL